MRHICLLMILLTAFSLLGASDGSLAIDESSCQVMLNAAVNYMDSIFMDRLVALQLVANTPEAKKGDWPGIKEYFYSLLMVHPASYFYAQRNGNYYTVEKDFTNLTMKDREFFSTLMEGDPVRGFPVYSRGTGKKSVVVAAPIISNNYAVGALGADIYLDELHNRLNREFDLPEGYTWFVINQEGNTMLDKETEYIFMNTLTQGSPSLISGIKTMLKSQSGKMQYEIGGVVRNAYYKKFPSMNWWMILAKKVENGIEAPPQLNISLKSFIPELQDGLNRIDKSLEELLSSTKTDFTKEEEIRVLLQSLVRDNPKIVDAAFINTKGVMQFIAPSEYRNYEGNDISDQPQVIEQIKNPRKIFSAAFKAVEGFLATDIVHPVYDTKNRLMGSISLLINPILLIRPILVDVNIPQDHELWIMQTDGTIVYDQDTEEIGRNLFTDPLYQDYQSLLTLGKKIASNPSGEGDYTFLAPNLKDKAIKTVVWDTVSLHGRQWRVLLAFSPYK